MARRRRKRKLLWQRLKPIIPKLLKPNMIIKSKKKRRIKKFLDEKMKER
jgi:hypothetical protein